MNRNSALAGSLLTMPDPPTPGSPALAPPRMEAAGAGFHNDGFDPTQQAYVLTREDASRPGALEVTLQATRSSPAIHPVLLLRGWGAGDPRIAIDGETAPHGPDVRVGRIHRLDGDDLVVWMRKESTVPVRISVLASE